MSKYKRLTTKCEVGIGLTETSGNIVNDYEKVVNRLADLEDKIENGTLVELPCKIGDRIWVIIGDKYVWGRKVGCISIRKYATVIDLYDKTGWKYIESVYLNDYKKTWFTDRSEAVSKACGVERGIKKC